MCDKITCLVLFLCVKRRGLCISPLVALSRRPIAFFALSLAIPAFVSAVSFAILSVYASYAACASSAGILSVPPLIRRLFRARYCSPAYDYSPYTMNLYVRHTVNFHPQPRNSSDPQPTTQFVVDSCNVLHSFIPQHSQHIQFITS